MIDDAHVGSLKEANKILRRKVNELSEIVLEREETIRNQDQMIVRLHAENVTYCRIIDRYQMNPFRRFASWLRSLVG